MWQQNNANVHVDAGQGFHLIFISNMNNEGKCDLCDLCDSAMFVCARWTGLSISILLVCLDFHFALVQCYMRVI